MNTKQLYFNKTIKNWDEAIPLGNGDLGCLIWNKSNKLRFSIDKAGIGVALIRRKISLILITAI